MFRFIALGLACGAFLGGCATAETDGPSQPDKVYRTGSNIPRRDGSIPDGVQTSTVSTGDTRLGPPTMPSPLPGGR